MNTSEYRARAREIIETLDPNTSTWWLSALSSRGGGAVREALEHVVLLLGEEPIDIADGVLDDDDGATGSLVVITATRLIRATFHSASIDTATTVIAESAPLASVRTVRADTTGTSADEDADWPARARITMVLDREVAGDTSVVVPAAFNAERHHAAAVAAIARRLPLV